MYMKRIIPVVTAQWGEIFSGGALLVFLWNLRFHEISIYET